MEWLYKILMSTTGANDKSFQLSLWVASVERVERLLVDFWTSLEPLLILDEAFFGLNESEQSRKDASSEELRVFRKLYQISV